MKTLVVLIVLLGTVSVSAGTVHSLERARYVKKYSDILGTFANGDIYYVKEASEKQLSEIRTIITQAEIKVVDGDFRYVVSHWQDGKVHQTIDISLSQLDQIKEYVNGDLSVSLDRGDGERGITIEGHDKATIVNNDVAKITISLRENSIYLTDPYLYQDKGEYFSENIYKINVFFR